MKTSEIYKWFKDSGFQTEWDENGEYEMCFVNDIPKIMRRYILWEQQKRDTEHGFNCTCADNQGGPCVTCTEEKYNL